MKKYRLIYKNKKGRILKEKNYEPYSITEAREFAREVLAESSLNNLHKIIVKREYYGIQPDI